VHCASVLRKCAWLSATVALASACQQTPPEMRLVDEAAAALGGTDRIRAVKTLVIEGSGSNPNIGQNVTPDAELNIWRVTDFRRTLDLANGRMYLRQVRAARFPFALATVQRQMQGLDGDVAYNRAQDGTATRASAVAARDRRVEMLHNPVAVVRAALDPGATVGNLHETGNVQVVDITTAKGDLVTLAVDTSTKLPASVTSMSAHANLGDVAIETTFQAYEDVNGVKLTTRYTTKLDKFVQADLEGGAAWRRPVPARAQSSGA